MSEFQVGDRVKHAARPGNYGTVQAVGAPGTFGPVIVVLFDKTPDFISPGTNRPIECSPDFMTKVDERWEKSPTKQVVDALETSWAAVPDPSGSSDVMPEEERAAEALKQRDEECRYGRGYVKVRTIY